MFHFIKKKSVRQKQNFTMLVPMLMPKNSCRQIYVIRNAYDATKDDCQRDLILMVYSFFVKEHK